MPIEELADQLQFLTRVTIDEDSHCRYCGQDLARDDVHEERKATAKRLNLTEEWALEDAKKKGWTPENKLRWTHHSVAGSSPMCPNEKCNGIYPLHHDKPKRWFCNRYITPFQNGGKICERGAVKVGEYRYRLHRFWEPTLPKVLFLMLNPSNADETVDDLTLTRCIDYAKRWEYGGLYVGNLNAFITPYPSVMKAAADPVGPENKQYIQELIPLAEKVVYAWGNDGGAEPEWLKELVPSPYCLGKNKDGSPKHPSRLSRNLDLVPFRTV